MPRSTSPDPRLPTKVEIKREVKSERIRDPSPTETPPEVDDDYDDARPFRTPEVARCQQLDKIQVAGSLSMTTIHALLTALVLLQADRFAAAALMIEREQGPVWCGIDYTESGSGYSIPTDPEYGPNLRLLQEWGVFRHAGRDKRAMYLRYFQVPKKAGVDRSIVNGRPTNKRADAPPPFRLPSVGQIMQWLLIWGEQSAVATGDFRHWFHQFTIPHQVSHLFSVRCGTAHYASRTLPMGFSWAPYLAQATSLALLHEAATARGFTVSDTEGSHVLPSHWQVRSSDGELVAILSVLYDNLLIIAKSQRIRDQLSSSLISTCKRHNAILKEEGCRKMEHSTGSLSFFGLDMRVVGPREIEWQHQQENRARWDSARVGESAPRRELARLGGIINWHAHVTGCPPADVVRALWTITRLIDSPTDRSDWSQEVYVPYETRRHLHEALQQACSNTRRVRTLLTPGPLPETLYVASDSSSPKGGYVTFNAAGAQIPSYTEHWSWDPAHGGHINHKEQRAALASLLKVLRSGHQDTEIRIAIDNSSACHAISNRCTRYDDLLPDMIELRERCCAQNCRILVSQVTTKDQAADPITRGAPLTADQSLRCLRVLGFESTTVTLDEDWCSLDPGSLQKFR